MSNYFLYSNCNFAAVIIPLLFSKQAWHFSVIFALFRASFWLSWLSSSSSPRGIKDSSNLFYPVMWQIQTSREGNSIQKTQPNPYVFSLIRKIWKLDKYKYCEICAKSFAGLWIYKLKCNSTWDGKSIFFCWFYADMVLFIINLFIKRSIKVNVVLKIKMQFKKTLENKRSARADIKKSFTIKRWIETRITVIVCL